jgi:hypothetical protein
VEPVVAVAVVLVVQRQVSLLVLHPKGLRVVLGLGLVSLQTLQVVVGAVVRRLLLQPAQGRVVLAAWVYQFIRY